MIQAALGIAWVSKVVAGPGAPVKVLLITDHQAAFAGRDVLVQLKTEDRQVAERTDGLAVEGGAVGLGAVLNQG